MKQDRNMRLLDAITIQHGPIDKLAGFFLSADNEVRDRGVRLTLRFDFDALLELNREESEKGNWYPLLPLFNPEYHDLKTNRAYWLSGINDRGETVVAQAGRIFDWQETNLVDQFKTIMYPDPKSDLPAYIDCSNAEEVTGRVCYSGSTWFHPDYRRLGLSRMLPRISRAFAYATWGQDWTISLIKREHVELKIPQAYGYSDIQYGFKVPGHPIGDLDLALVRMSPTELLSDIEGFVTERRERRNTFVGGTQVASAR